MRLYAASDEEKMHSRKLLKEWAGEGFLSQEQFERLEPETVCELRTTNIFLRVVLFFFTVIVVAAAAGLFFVVSQPRDQATGVLCLFFAVACYGGAEVAGSQFHLYRHGIEEALAVGAVAFLCGGLEILLLSPPAAHSGDFLMPAVGALFSLWIWYRFGLWYTFLAAMVFAVFLPGPWLSSQSALHVVVAAEYAVGLVCLGTIRLRHRFDYLDRAYSVAEALLWLGLYIAINLKVSSLDLLQPWSGARDVTHFGALFYWSTWVLTWCLPPVILTRGVQQKDRFVMAVGAIATLLTFITNKPYLGWERHTWDPMLQGIVLVGTALFLRRWLGHGPDGVRHGFTSARLSAKDDRWRDAVAFSGLGLPHSLTHGPEHSAPEGPATGGASGGGGASRDF